MHLYMHTDEYGIMWTDDGYGMCSQSRLMSAISRCSLIKLLNCCCRSHRRRSWGCGGTSPPEFGVGDANANHPPPRFCHIDTKGSVLWPSQYAKIRFRPGFCPGHRWGAHDAPLDFLVGWGEDTPRHRPTFGAHQNSSQMYAYDRSVLTSDCDLIKKMMMISCLNCRG